MQPSQVIPVEPAGLPPGWADAHAAVAADPTLQFDFQAAVPPRPPGWLEPLLRLLEWIAPLLQWVFWGLVAGGAVLILVLIGRELVKIRVEARTRRSAAIEAIEPWRPSQADARALLGEADALAREGRFTEAAHLILLRSIADLTDRRPNVVRPALTARDIGGLDALPAPARPAFVRIARAVEAGLFAGRPLDARAFAACRDDYEAFALPEGWRR